jgi:hypothetical protein
MRTFHQVRLTMEAIKKRSPIPFQETTQHFPEHHLKLLNTFQNITASHTMGGVLAQNMPACNLAHTAVLRLLCVWKNKRMGV